MRPETVESKVTIAGVNVEPAVQGLPWRALRVGASCSAKT